MDRPVLTLEAALKAGTLGVLFTRVVENMNERMAGRESDCREWLRRPEDIVDFLNEAKPMINESMANNTTRLAINLRVAVTEEIQQWTHTNYAIS